METTVINANIIKEVDLRADVELPEWIRGPKGDTYTLTEEDIAEIASKVDGLKIELVEELPEVGDSKKLYLKKKEDSESDSYDEYLFVNGKWEVVGSTKVDLSQYYTKEETYNKEEVYNKEEIDSLIENPQVFVIHTKNTRGGSGHNRFWSEYSYNDIKQAIREGKVPVLLLDYSLYPDTPEYYKDFKIAYMTNIDEMTDKISFVRFDGSKTGETYRGQFYYLRKNAEQSSYGYEIDWIKDSNAYGFTLPTTTELDKYQKKLTAGNNITIENNVISATGGGDASIPVINEDGTMTEADLIALDDGWYLAKNPIQFGPFIVEGLIKRFTEENEELRYGVYLSKILTDLWRSEDGRLYSSNSHIVGDMNDDFQYLYSYYQNGNLCLTLDREWLRRKVEEYAPKSDASNFYNFEPGEEPTEKGLEILNKAWNTDVAYNYEYGDCAIFLEGIPVQLIRDNNLFRLSGTYHEFTANDGHSEIFCGTITPTLTEGVITSYIVELGGLPYDGARVSLTEMMIKSLIDDKAISYNFKVGESKTDVGLRIVKDLWEGNFGKYNLSFNGEPIFKVGKDTTYNWLVCTILRANYQSPAGPQLVGRVIIPTFENDEIVGYTVSSSSAGGNYVVGHTNDQINEMIDARAKGLPETPTENGNYSLVATVKNGEVEFAWKSISGVWQLPTQINNDLKLFQAATINQVNNALEVY